MDESAGFTLIALLAIVCFIFFGLGHSSGVKDTRKEAVEAGVGRWIPSSDGELTFEFISSTTARKVEQ